ncbi:MAG: exported protein of unknown function [Frankiales bacterium]|nr:exported protein of unknown function [Frankiales bacterium]
MAALALAATGVLVLRDELMTVHHRSAPGSVTEVLLAARTHKDPMYLPALTGSLVESCRMTVDASVRISPLVQVRPGAFSFELRPALDRFGRREMRGCCRTCARRTCSWTCGSS